MKVLRQSDDQFAMTLASAEAQIFINCLNETIRRIPAREYQTRMGAEIGEIKAIIDPLERVLKMLPS